MMKRILILLVLSVVGLGCEAQDTAEPDTLIGPAIDPFCIYNSQWGFDKSQSTSYEEGHWFHPPNMSFIGDDVRFSLGVHPGEFRGNEYNNYFEIYFKTTSEIDRIHLTIDKVKIFEGFSVKIGEATGEDAKTIAKELLNIQTVDTFLKFSCSGQKLEFASDENNENVPFRVYHWSRTN